MPGVFGTWCRTNIFLCVCAAVALLAASVSCAYATYTRIYYHVGNWDVFSGQTDNGRPFCGIGTTEPGDGRSLSIQFDIGEQVVDFRAARAGWSIPAGTKLSAVIRFSPKLHWTARAEGNANLVRWSLNRADTQAFDDRFRHTRSMTLVFPDGNEPPWTISLTGSRRADNAFGRCIADLGHDGPAERLQARHTTQPFRAAPGASFAQAPSGEHAATPR
jgi:hypothetical protein